MGNEGNEAQPCGVKDWKPMTDNRLARLWKIARAVESLRVVSALFDALAEIERLREVEARLLGRTAPTRISAGPPPVIYVILKPLPDRGVETGRVELVAETTTRPSAEAIIATLREGEAGPFGIAEYVPAEAAAKEREACAVECEVVAKHGFGKMGPLAYAGAMACAKYIRSRTSRTPLATFEELHERTWSHGESLGPCFCGGVTVVEVAQDGSASLVCPHHQGGGPRRWPLSRERIALADIKPEAFCVSTEKP